MNHIAQSNSPNSGDTSICGVPIVFPEEPAIPAQVHRDHPDLFKLCVDCVGLLALLDLAALDLDSTEVACSKCGETDLWASRGVADTAYSCPSCTYSWSI